MADRKISELSAITNLSGDDLLLVVNDPSGTPTSNKVTLTNLFANVVPNVVHKGTVTNTGNTTFSGTTMTVSANATYSGTLTVSGTLVESGISTRSGVQVFNGNTIHNDTLFANGGLVISSAVSSGGSNIIGLNGNLNANNAIASGTITDAMLATNIDKYMEKANTTLLVDDRMQVANVNVLVNDRMQVANTNALVNDRIQVANGVLKTSDLEQVMSANLVVDAGADVATSGVHISNGQINIFSDTGSPSLVDFYCEVTNIHKVRLQAPAHADFSGNVAVTLPIKSGNVATTNSETFVGTTSTENLNVGGSFRILTKSSDPATSNAANEEITAGSVFYSNTHLYIATDENTIKRVALSTF